MRHAQRGNAKSARVWWSASLLLFACLLTAEQTHAATASLKIAIVSRTVFYLPLWIAERKGYFEARGSAAAIEVYDNAERINEDLRAGRVQIAISTPESVILDAYNGGPLRIIAGNAERLPHFVIARPHITSLPKLRGARFGVLSLQEGTTYLVHRVAEAAGLKSGEYQVVPVGGAPTRWHLLQQGLIDAGLQPFPLSYEAEAAGFTNLGPVAEYVPDYLFTSVNVDGRWANMNASRVTAFLSALRLGLHDMKQDSAEAAVIASEELRTPLPLAQRAVADTERLRILSPDLSISNRAFAATVETLQSVGALPRERRLNPDIVVDGRFLELSSTAPR